MGDKTAIGPPVADVIETEIDGEISIYNPKSEQVTVLNATASNVWLLCDGEHSISEVKALLASSYETDVASISDDVDRTIDMLRKSGLIE